MNPEEKARKKIDEELTAAGWSVQDSDQVNLRAARGEGLDRGRSSDDILSLLRAWS